MKQAALRRLLVAMLAGLAVQAEAAPHAKAAQRTAVDVMQAREASATLLADAGGSQPIAAPRVHADEAAHADETRPHPAGFCGALLLAIAAGGATAWALMRVGRSPAEPPPERRSPAALDATLPGAPPAERENPER